MIKYLIIEESIMRLNLIRTDIDNSWSITRIAKERPPISWEKVLRDCVPELETIDIVLEEQRSIYGDYYPLRKNIFAALDKTPLFSVKVVIIGQDPYYQTININGTAQPRAVGLSFSVDRRDTVPVSLKNIYKELASTIPDFVEPNHGDLIEWANQGVLLLNMCLTVRAGEAGAHGDIWLGVHRKLFKAISEVNPHCIYLLWGKEAEKIGPMLGEKSIKLNAAHPASRYQSTRYKDKSEPYDPKDGWFGNNHFNQVNDILVKRGKSPINWKLSSIETLVAQDTPMIAREENRVFSPININQQVNIPKPQPQTFQPIKEQSYIPTIQMWKSPEQIVIPQIPKIQFNIPDQVNTSSIKLPFIQPLL